MVILGDIKGFCQVLFFPPQLSSHVTIITVKTIEKAVI